MVFLSQETQSFAHTILGGKHLIVANAEHGSDIRTCLECLCEGTVGLSEPILYAWIPGPEFFNSPVVFESPPSHPWPGSGYFLQLKE